MLVTLARQALGENACYLTKADSVHRGQATNAGAQPVSRGMV